VRRTLEIANVQGMMPFNETVAEGLASLAAAALRSPERARPGLVGAHVEDATARAGVTIVRAQVENEAPVHRVAADAGTRESDPPVDEGQLAA
jgi:hypothetical protein